MCLEKSLIIKSGWQDAQGIAEQQVTVCMRADVRRGKQKRCGLLNG
jgi:hypothetical protein